ncbi:unnamed protein product, partial [Adineta ricciae]
MALISSPFFFGKNPSNSSLSYYSKVTTLPKINPTSNEPISSSSLDLRTQSKLSQRSNCEQIPENVSFTVGEDRNQIRLPVFGRRPSTMSEKSTDRERIVGLDELLSILREKVRSQENDIRIKFRHSIDFDSNGKISLQAFKHILASIFGIQRQISPNQIEKLIEKLHLSNLTKISFDDFHRSLSLDRSTVKSSSQSYLSKRTAGQMFLILKDKARTKFIVFGSEDLVRFCPSLNDGQPRKIFKSQLQNGLIDMGYRMVDKEFDKLWNKFDPDGFHVINSEKFLKKLTNEHFLVESCSTSRSETQEQQSAILKASFMKSSSSNPNEHFDENQIQKWFKEKLPQCFDQLENRFNDLDPFKTGQVSSQIFLEQLKSFGLKLEETLLEYFLKRLNVSSALNDQLIKYEEVLNAFKQLVGSNKKKSKEENPLPKEDFVQSSMEKQVEYLISLNYERIQEKMKSFDKKQSGTIENNEMKTIIEDLLEFPIRPDEFDQLNKHFPKNPLGKINYLIYLKQIKERTNSLQTIPEENESSHRSEQIPQWDYMRSTNIRESLKQQHINEKQIAKESCSNETHENTNPRTISELNQILKTLIQTRIKDIEQEFDQIDYGSYRELTHDYLYRLLKRFPIKPEITKKEVELLWCQCHLKENGTLDFDEFLRQFGYSKRSAHYPNAKQNPPQKGDRDYLLTSNKLYADTILVHQTTKQFIKNNWNQFQREFTQIDPYRTGFIHSEEFDEIFQELYPNIIQQDLDFIKKHFQNTNDSRINYVEFLKQYSPNDELFHENEQRTRRPPTTINENIRRN